MKKIVMLIAVIGLSACTSMEAMQFSNALNNVATQQQIHQLQMQQYQFRRF